MEAILEIDERISPHIKGHAGDADVVSTSCSDGTVIAFVERPEVAEGAPLMAEPMRLGRSRLSYLLPFLPCLFLLSTRRVSQKVLSELT